MVPRSALSCNYARLVAVCDAKRGHHFLQADFTGLIPRWNRILSVCRPSRHSACLILFRLGCPSFPLWEIVSIHGPAKHLSLRFAFDFADKPKKTVPHPPCSEPLNAKTSGIQFLPFPLGYRIPHGSPPHGQRAVVFTIARFIALKTVLLSKLLTPAEGLAPKAAQASLILLF